MHCIDHNIREFIIVFIKITSGKCSTSKIIRKILDTYLGKSENIFLIFSYHPEQIKLNNSIVLKKKQIMHNLFKQNKNIQCKSGYFPPK